jgi:hypothetical protein
VGPNLVRCGVGDLPLIGILGPLTSLSSTASALRVKVGSGPHVRLVIVTVPLAASSWPEVSLSSPDASGTAVKSVNALLSLSPADSGRTKRGPRSATRSRRASNERIGARRVRPRKASFGEKKARR